MVKNIRLHRRKALLTLCYASHSAQVHTLHTSHSFCRLEAGSAVFKNKQTFRLAFIFLNLRLKSDVMATLDNQDAISKLL